LADGGEAARLRHEDLIGTNIPSGGALAGSGDQRYLYYMSYVAA
jgi:hypothetical protein